ncbi:MAG: hypothetical protein LBD25_07665 [Coriobacteriales bacterium]|jgi:glycine cleavage system aminomethyltransferase T|nr:hypothetical protein [Coriobacteriales bacterium]
MMAGQVSPYALGRFVIRELLGKIRIAGDAAARFVQAMTTVEGARLAQLGNVAPALVLTGEGEVIDVVTVARSGDAEYMLVTSSETAREAAAWLGAHAALADDESAVFEGLEITDETEKLACVSLFGPPAPAVLEELGASLPDADDSVGVGSLTVASLDGIPALVLRYPLLPEGHHEVFCAPAHLDALEHVLLSFPELDPLPAAEYAALRRKAGTWFEGAQEAAYRHPDTPALAALLRPGLDFVGARSLHERRVAGSKHPTTRG